MSGAVDTGQAVGGQAVGLPLSFAAWQRAHQRRTRREDTLRWGLSLLAVLAVSGGVVGWVMHLPPPVMAVPEPPPAAIAIDMAPEPVSPPTPPSDLPPGPQQTQSIPDPAPVEPPKVTAPPSPAPNPPVPVPRPEKPRKQVKKHKPVPMLAKPTPDKTPPAEETTAPPSSEAPPALTQATPAPGAASSKASRDPVSWQGALLAQLEKFKRYPADAMADRQEGVPTVTFSMDRKGHVLSVILASSSGHPLLDQEAVALPRRAQPLPIPPESVQGDPITLTVPVEFYIHAAGN
ncbi:TonB family protein [Acetobacter lambici]|uniref:Energy transducer TonB n=1 Tax=Acetobacter lambici TaxID=1332824 RepID=A0ABT1F444_9PROT|nr:energy transducer TonB [Acetobacter lambici]MCP1243875.1 energy transducer TonB [Acetobacter lambici]MCP1259970.1 energy transducer TonB [Acetobacter lambici]NHO58097.1 TonB family protein [Acetobacter lambici]